jgi:hypothetical protein
MVLVLYCVKGIGAGAGSMLMAYVSNMVTTIVGAASYLDASATSKSHVSRFCVGRACILPTYSICSGICVIYFLVSIRLRKRIVGTPV